MNKKILVASVLGLGLAVAGTGWAVASHQGFGPMGGGGHCKFGARFARLHADFMADRILRVVDATPEQRTQVEAIVEKAFAEHAKYRGQHEAMHADAVAILTADTVDRTRLEELRARHIRIADQGSRHLVNVVADIADVLTPEQRQKLAAHVKEMME